MQQSPLASWPGSARFEAEFWHLDAAAAMQGGLPEYRLATRSRPSEKR